MPDRSSRHSLEIEQSGHPASQMSINGADSLSSESSGQALDSRFMQRRLQRLNTEQGFREQRQASSQHPIHAQLPQHQHQQHLPAAQHSYLADQPLSARIPQTNIVAASTTTSATTPSSASPQFRHDTPQPPQYQPLRNFAKLHDDGPAQVDLIARKIADLRILDDERGAADTGSPVLVVSQFTLYADTRKGRRPSWNAAAGQVRPCGWTARCRCSPPTHPSRRSRSTAWSRGPTFRGERYPPEHARGTGSRRYGVGAAAAATGQRLRT